MAYFVNLLVKMNDIFKTIISFINNDIADIKNLF